MSLAKSPEVKIRSFNNNCMQSNPNKFQIILFGTSIQTGSIKINSDIVSHLCSMANKRVCTSTGFESTRYCKQLKHGESFY